MTQSFSSFMEKFSEIISANMKDELMTNAVEDSQLGTYGYIGITRHKAAHKMSPSQNPYFFSVDYRGELLFMQDCKDCLTAGEFWEHHKETIMKSTKEPAPPESEIYSPESSDQ